VELTLVVSVKKFTKQTRGNTIIDIAWESAVSGENGTLPEGTPTATRLDWIEAAKGVGITSMILVHSIIPTVNSITTHLSSFTIPLSAVMVLFVPLSPNIDTYLAPEELVFWFLYGNGPPLSASHLWFLPVLYFGLMLFVVADRLMQDLPVYSRWILAAVFPLMAIMTQSVFAPALVPWRMGGVLLAATFVLFGNMIRHYRGMGWWRSSSTVHDIVLFFLLSILLILVSSFNGFTDIAVDNFGMSVWLYLMAGTSGTIVAFLVSSALLSISSLKRVFMTLGKDSQELYEIHPAAFYLAPPIAVLLGWPYDDPAFAGAFWTSRFLLGIGVGFMLTKYLITRNRVLAVLFRGSQRTTPSSAVKEGQPAA
jgi:fucose 4-O-acetylase-like acetyltransferase